MEKIWMEQNNHPVEIFYLKFKLSLIVLMYTDRDKTFLKFDFCSLQFVGHFWNHDEHHVEIWNHNLLNIMKFAFYDEEALFHTTW